MATVEPEAHELRRRLLDIVVRYPGLHLREISRLAALPASHAQYHLRILERNTLLVSQRQEENLRYYPTKATPVGDVPALAARDRDLLQLIRKPAVFRILVTLLADGPFALTALAKRCGVAPSTMSYHMERLAQRGITHKSEAPENLWSLVDANRVRSVLVAHEPPPRLIEGYLDVWQRIAP